MSRAVNDGSRASTSDSGATGGDFGAQPITTTGSITTGTLQVTGTTYTAALQVDACTPNFLCQEQVNLGEGYLKKPFVLEGGHIPVPTGPGLGIEVDEAALAEKLYDGSHENPRLWHADGSLADW